VQTMWAIAVSPSSRWMRITSSVVLRRVLPAAPQVTETKPGSRRLSSPRVRSSERVPAALFGGKNSKEKTGAPRPNSAAIRTAGFYQSPPGSFPLTRRDGPAILPPMSVLVSGSVAVDSIMVFRGRFKDLILPDKIHALNVAFHVPELRRTWGGCGANIAYNLRLLGEEPLLLAAVGADFAAYAEWLDAHGVRRDWIRQLEGESTAGAYITTDLDDNQITGFHPGAMDRAHEASLDSVDEPFEVGIVSPNGKRAMQEVARGLKAGSAQCVIDPGQGLPLFEPAELVELIDGADVYVVNDYEWSMTLERSGLTGDEIAARVGAIIVTRGERGSVLRRGDDQLEIRPVEAEAVVDPTGAGDAYRAGLLTGMARGWPLEKSARVGTLIGSMAVAHAGTQSLRFELDAFRARFEREFGESLE